MRRLLSRLRSKPCIRRCDAALGLWRRAKVNTVDPMIRVCFERKSRV